MVKPKRDKILEFILDKLLDAFLYRDPIDMAEMYGWAARAYLNGLISASERKVLDKLCETIETRSYPKK